MDNVKKLEREGYVIKLEMRDQTLVVEAALKNNLVDIYWLQISEDTMISNKMVFENPRELYDYLEDQCFSNECLEFNPPKEIIIVYKLGKNVKKMSLLMTEKILTKQELQSVHQAKIHSLQIQVQRLKKELDQNFRVMELQIIQEEKDMEIMMLKSIIEEQKQQLRNERSRVIRQNNQDQDGLLRDNQQLKQQIINKKKQMLQLEQTVQTQAMIIQELQSLAKQNRQIIAAFTGQNKLSKPQESKNLLFSHLLVFKPNKKSLNINYYNLNGNILTKNSESLSGTGKFLYSDSPIPKIGRFHYKLRHMYSAALPNFRIGVIGRQNLEAEAYMNAGQSDSIMYYCFNTDKQVIYQGKKKIQGFKVKKEEAITILIDAQQSQVEWYLQQNLQLISAFTQSMRSASQLYFFVQLWQNSDALEIITQ